MQNSPNNSNRENVNFYILRLSLFAVKGFKEKKKQSNLYRTINSILRFLFVCFKTAGLSYETYGSYV